MPTVAPLYDVVPIAEVEPRTRFLSMRVDGLIAPNDVVGGNVVSEAAGWGIAAGEAEGLVRECLEGLARGIHAASAVYPAAAKRHEAASLARVERLGNL